MIETTKPEAPTEAGGQVERVVRGYETNPRGHKWVAEDGVVNIFAFNPSDLHNGPLCEKCGYGFCHHCEAGPDNDCPVP